MAITPQTPPTTYTEGNCVEYQPISEVFTFNLNCGVSRSQNQHIQLMFLNRYGHYDYVRLMFNRFQGLSIDRQQYKSLNIDWGSDNPIKTQYSRGLNDSDVIMVETVLVNSGWYENPYHAI